MSFLACNYPTEQESSTHSKQQHNTSKELVLWNCLIHWTKENAPNVNFKLNSGATDKELEALEKLIQHELPEDFKNFYRIHNGQTAYKSNGLIDANVLMSIERISEEWKQLKSFIDRHPEGTPTTSENENIIKNNWWNPLWIPIIDEGTGDFVCIDLDPLSKGENGQIIQVVHDDFYRPLYAKSFSEWFENYITKLESGEYVYSKEWGGIIEKSFLRSITNQKIDLHLELSRQNSSDYMMSLGDSILAFIDPKLYNPFLGYNITDIKNSLINFNLHTNSTDNSEFIFSYKKSRLNLVYWETDEITSEYHQLTDTLLFGNIKEPYISFPSGVYTGMTKQEFINEFFENADRYINNIHTIIVWENEIAESANVYYFKDDILTNVEFGYK